MSHISDCIVCQINGQVRIVDALFIRRNNRLLYLEAPQDSAYTGN